MSKEGDNGLQSATRLIATLFGAPKEAPLYPHVDMRGSKQAQTLYVELPNQYTRGFLLSGAQAKGREALMVSTKFSYHAPLVVAGMYPTSEDRSPEDMALVIKASEDKITTVAVLDGVTGSGSSGPFAEALAKVIASQGQLDIKGFFNPLNQTWLNTYSQTHAQFQGRGDASMQIVQCKPVRDGYEVTTAIMGVQAIDGRELTGFTLVVRPDGTSRFFEAPVQQGGIDPKHIAIAQEVFPRGSQIAVMTDQIANPWRKDPAAFVKVFASIFPQGAQNADMKQLQKFQEQMRKYGSDDGTFIFMNLA